MDKEKEKADKATEKAQEPKAEKAEDDQKKEPTPEARIAALQAQVSMLQAQVAADRTARESQEQEIATLKDAVTDWQDKFASMQRYASSMASDMKRVKANSANEVALGKEKLVKELLPILDDFDRALDTAKNDQSKDYEKMLEGVEMVSGKFYQLLSGSYGLVKMETDGQPFDPNKHQALQIIKDKKYKEKVVAMTFSAGYLLGDKVLRPAKVVIGQPLN